ncbi:MAG TPA: hypothetical protein VHT34_14375 [Clostridia bacterium]|nr:hypothetical protein [Clostridia bacterium]
MNKSGVIIMKIISTIGVMAFFYPAAMLINLSVRDFWGGRGAVFAFSFAFAGFLTAALINRRSNIFVYCSLIIPAVVVLVLFKDVQIAAVSSKISSESVANWRIALKLIIAMVSYIIGLSGYRNEYSEMLSERKIALGVLLTSVPYIIFDLLDKGAIILYFALVFILLSIVVLVQANTDKLFAGAEKKFRDSSGNAQKFNLTSIFLFFSAILLLFSMRNVLKVFAYLKTALSNFFLRLGNGIGNSVTGLGKKNNHENNPVVHHKHPKTSYLGIALEIIFLILAIIVLLYFLYKIFCFIKRKLKDKGNRNFAENDDFYDEVEEIVVKTHNISIQKPKKEKKSFKKVSEISDPVSKVRYIYSIILAKLKELKIDIKKSSTSNEILKKASVLKGIEGSLSEATGIYEEARYGNHIPNESEVACMLDNCSKIASIAEDK